MMMMHCLVLISTGNSLELPQRFLEELPVLGWNTDNPEGGALIELIDVWEDPVRDGQRHSPGRGS